MILIIRNSQTLLACLDNARNIPLFQNFERINSFVRNEKAKDFIHLAHDSRIENESKSQSNQ